VPPALSSGGGQIGIYNHIYFDATLVKNQFHNKKNEYRMSNKESPSLKAGIAASFFCGVSWPANWTSPIFWFMVSQRHLPPNICPAANETGAEQ
jgi:hypothetical protein